MSFKRFLIKSSGGPHIRRSRAIYTILVEGIMGNIYVTLFLICTSCLGGDVVQRKSLRTDDARRTLDKDRSEKLTLSLRLRLGKLVKTKGNDNCVTNAFPFKLRCFSGCHTRCEQCNIKPLSLATDL